MSPHKMSRRRSKGSTCVASALTLITCLLLSVSAWAPASVYAQGAVSGEREDKTVDAALQAEIIDSVAQALNEVYVYPDVALKMEKHLRQQLKEGAYKDITSCREFTEHLTADLQKVSKDRHLHLHFVTQEMMEAYQQDTLTEAGRERELEELRRDNFGFKKVELLAGNVGYVDFRQFANAREAGPTAEAALNFLAYTDAIIFDLRRNGGGSPSMIQLISSHLFDTLVHLNSFYIRKEDTTQQFWTQAWVPGPDLSDVDLYVLTSNYTFSGAEEFTYNLKNLKRATIVGETTGGGAHPVDIRIFENLNVGMSLPFGRAVNPITGTNWEGTGIAPDIAVAEKDALDVAYLEALKSLTAKEQNPQRKQVLDWLIAYKEALLKPFPLEPSAMPEYVGTYGPRVISQEGTQLYYQRGDNPRYTLVPMAKDLFALKGLDYFKIEFNRDDQKKVVRLTGHYSDGHTDSHDREND